jgi:hypothetical protein
MSAVPPGLDKQIHESRDRFSHGRRAPELSPRLPALIHQIGWPLACVELIVNIQPPGPATVNESWIRPRLIGDGDNPFSA